MFAEGCISTLDFVVFPGGQVVTGYVACFGCGVVGKVVRVWGLGFYLRIAALCGLF